MHTTQFLMSLYKCIIFMILILAHLFTFRCVYTVPVALPIVNDYIFDVAVTKPVETDKIIPSNQKKRDTYLYEPSSEFLDRFLNLPHLNSSEFSDQYKDLNLFALSQKHNTNIQEYDKTDVIQPYIDFEEFNSRVFANKGQRQFHQFSLVARPFPFHNTRPINNSQVQKTKPKADRLDPALLFKPTSIICQNTIHIIQCMNLCLDIEYEFKLQDKLFERNEGSELYIREYDKRHQVDWTVIKDLNLKRRIKFYIGLAGLCFGNGAQIQDIFSKRLSANLEYDLIDLLDYLKANNGAPEIVNLKNYVNSISNILTDSSLIERW